MPNIPSKFGAPVSMPETQALTNIVNQGMPAISSKFGCADESYGLQDPKPFQFGYDLPGTKTQLHLHGDDEDTITHGHIVPYGHKPNEKPFVELNSFQASLASLDAENIGFKKFK